MSQHEDKPEEHTRLGDETFMTASDLQAYMDRRARAQEAKDSTSSDAVKAARDELIKKLSEPLKLDAKTVPTLVENLKKRLTLAAERGETEILILRFPNALATDKGRAINNDEPDWPDTLTGRPRQIYEIWRDHLRDAGFRLSAMVVEWPEGMPGDLGMYLSWKQDVPT